jgi:hypothetical protein
MAAGDTTQGHRLADGDYFQAPRGSYWKNTAGVWNCVTPNGRMGNLSGHNVTENGDGTITVQPSILVSEPPHRPQWHGFLKDGIWTEV